MSGASCLHGPLPAMDFLCGLGQVTRLPWASVPYHCKRQSICSLHRGAGETDMLQGKCDEAVGFLRFILQGQSYREPPKYWLASIQKWKLFIMLELFQETKILSKILPFLPLPCPPSNKKNNNYNLILLKDLIKSHLSFSSAFPSGLCTSWK